MWWRKVPPKPKIESRRVTFASDLEAWWVPPADKAVWPAMQKIIGDGCEYPWHWAELERMEKEKAEAKQEARKQRKQKAKQQKHRKKRLRLMQLLQEAWEEQLALMEPSPILKLKGGGDEEKPKEEEPIYIYIYIYIFRNPFSVAFFP